MSKHIVYAVAGQACRKVRLTEPVSWSDAVARWYTLDDMRRSGADLSVAKHGSVRYFAVRSDDDPHWPARGKRRAPKVHA